MKIVANLFKPGLPHRIFLAGRKLNGILKKEEAGAYRSWEKSEKLVPGGLLGCLLPTTTPSRAAKQSFYSNPLLSNVVFNRKFLAGTFRILGKVHLDIAYWRTMDATLNMDAQAKYLHWF